RPSGSVAARPPNSPRSDVDDGAGERSGDARHALDLRDDEPAEVIDVVRLGADDDVVGPGYVVSLVHAGDKPDRPRHVGCFPDLSLDEYVSLDHVALRSSVMIVTLP